MGVRVTIEDPDGNRLGEWQRDAHGNLIGLLDFRDLRVQNSTRVKRWHGPDATPWEGTDWACAMGGECGEALNVVKKMRRAETNARNDGDPDAEELRADLADELADTIIYADLLALHYGIDLAAAVTDKFNRTSERYGFPERL